MKTFPYTLNGNTWHLCLNGAALFDIYEKYGDKGFVTDHIAGNDKNAFQATCWMLAKLAEQFGSFALESEEYSLILRLNQAYAAVEQLTRENYVGVFARILSAYKEDGFDRVNPSILKSAVQALYPDFTERQIGLRRFSDVLRTLEREGLLRLKTDEGGNMLVHIL